MHQSQIDSKIDEVLEGFRKRAMDAVNKITSLIDSQDERIALDASKYTVKIMGAEVERVNHSGKVQFEPITFSREDDNDE